MEYYNRYLVGYQSPGIMASTAFTTPSTVFKILKECFKTAFFTFVILFEGPVLLSQPLGYLLLHRGSKLNDLGLLRVSLLRPAMCIICHTAARRTTTLGCISTRFTANIRGVNPNNFSKLNLFQAGFFERLNLIPLCQNELVVVFRNKQSKDCKLGQTLKCPQKHFIVCF